MELSICIPFKNDYELIDSVVKNIIDTAESYDYEIIVYNDGSTQPSGKPEQLTLDYKNTRVINASQSFGVGAAFDRCVEQAKGEYLILMGCDVYAHKGWHTKVLEAVKSNPTTIGCAVCVGDKPKANGSFTKYYGADLLIKMSNDDLPLHSKLRERKGGYTDLFRGKWAEKRGNDVPYEISCLMGAYYFCTKEWYNYIGGWDTIAGKRYRGISNWGHTEPYISVKSYLCGGNCIIFPNIEVTHIFSRMDEYITVGRRRPHLQRRSLGKGGRSEFDMWWNALLMVETMVLSESRRNQLYDFVNLELNFNAARNMIKRNYEYVESLREQNRQKFKYDITLFAEKFGCRL